MFLKYYKDSRLNVHSKDRITGYGATCDLYYVYLNGKNILQMQDVYQLDEQKDLYLKRKYNAFRFIQEYYKQNTASLLE